MKEPSMKGATVIAQRSPRAWILTACALTTVLALGTALAVAEETSSAPAAKPTGLPAGLDWKFNFDAAWGSFGFAHSLYTNPKPEEPSGDLSDNWFEGFVKPALSATWTARNTSQVYGKLSAVGERTYGTPPSLVGEDSSSFNLEDANIGWRSGKALKQGENVLDFTVGRARYELGHGMLLYDGASEGGSRGGYWSNARKAFAMAVIGRYKPGHHLLESFYLDKDDLPEADSRSRLWGVNYQYAIGEATTLGATYLRFYADPNIKPQRDGLDVYNLRAYTAPFSKVKPLSFELEYAKEDNGDALDSKAWTALAAWQFEGKWKPKLSYRYAFFEGDDPGTAKNEAFDPLMPGFYDWGSWWQGEIAGEYFVSNSNLISHQVRVHTTPNDKIGTGIFLYKFLLDQPAALGAGVTSDDVATEFDWYMDWKLNQNFTVSFIAAFADPGKAVEQAFDRTQNFYYGMVYLAYSY
jgi:alginate export protein